MAAPRVVNIFEQAPLAWQYHQQNSPLAVLLGSCAVLVILVRWQKKKLQSDWSPAGIAVKLLLAFVFFTIVSTLYHRIMKYFNNPTPTAR